MNKTKYWIVVIGFAWCGVIPETSIYGQSSVSVGVRVPLPSVQIRVESDFYEPLAPQGEWVVVGSYGRCWRPARVEAGWRPYCNGRWEHTEAGWYWESDEPWAWATYHYGRWDYTDQYGWYWVPQVQWAPAWVSWHNGGGYVGWAPLQPSVSISASGYVGFSQARVSPRAFVFVEQRQFLEPIRPKMVVVNNTTIINKTTVINNTKIVNNTVVNEGPATAVIEKASGRKVQTVAVQELRHKQEAAVVSRQSAAAKKAPAAAASEAEPRGKKATAAPAPTQVEPAAPTRESAAPVPNTEGRREKQQPAATPSEIRRESKPEGNSPEVKPQPAESKADKHAETQPKRTKQSGKKSQPSTREKPAANESNGANPAADNHREKKPK